MLPAWRNTATLVESASLARSIALMVFTDLAPVLATCAHIIAALAVTVDAVFHKRHVPSIIGWTGLAWLAPVAGAALYLLLGINRIHRAGIAMGLTTIWAESAVLEGRQDAAVTDDEIRRLYPDLTGLARLSERITRRPLAAGNRVEPLLDGDSAYPAMLAAIDGARRSVALLSYIFDNDEAGQLFLQALQRAVGRGVHVRVLVDAVGARYSRPNMVRELQRAGVTAAAFLPTRVPRLFRYANLRNHRKILVVDGETGFTGGMNIRIGHWIGRRPASPVRCVHFRIQGPVVADLQRTFAIDWAFSTKEQLHGPTWFPSLGMHDSVAARGIPDGPDADLDNVPQILHGALSAARHSVRVVTPYFIPDNVLLAALKVASMRGVAVDIVLPYRSNIPLVDWASRPQLADLLDKGCRIFLTPAPFDHSKLFLVDGLWSLIGSTNWDTRSLRLNFEYNLECYDARLAMQLNALIDAKVASAHQLSAAELRASPFLVRLRDGLARLLSPYL